MPVIVVGADTTSGEAILKGLDEPGREIRVFVSDPNIGARLRNRGLKVALGDVSDESHIETASAGCFTAILITEAACDQRERSFAPDPETVTKGWASAVSASSVTRVIWVASDTPPSTDTKEVATVDPDDHEMAKKVVQLDDVQTIQ